MSKPLDREIDDNTIRLYYDFLGGTPRWMRDAECTLNDDGSLDPIADREKIARDYCPSCPVKKQCEQWGEDHDVNIGVFGGIVFNPE